LARVDDRTGPDVVADRASGDTEATPAEDAMRIALRRRGLAALGIATASVVLAVVCVVSFGFELSLRHQRHDLAQRARIESAALGGTAIRRADVEGMTVERRTELARIISRRLAGQARIGFALYAPDGHLLLATETGSSPSAGSAALYAPRLTLAGTVRTGGGREPEVASADSSIKAEFAPLVLNRVREGTIAVWVSRGAMEGAALDAALPFALIVPFLLILLLVPLLPLLRRTVRDIRAGFDERETQALHDGLTGLPNRRLFEDRVRLALKRARREGGTTAMLLLDLDRFKEINDTLGHAVGDRFLCEVAGRLSSTIRGLDTVARLGGDEFALVLNHVDRKGACDAAERVDRALRAPSVIGGITMTVGASIGIAMYPEHGEDAGALLQHADIAMYSAKRGGTPFEFYEPTDDHNDPMRLLLRQDLQRAFESGELVLHYQPKLDLRTNDVTGVEGLLRWNHPTLGVLEAQHFMPIAEEIGVASAISERAVADAIRQCGEWRRRGIDLSVAVNLGARNLVDPQLPQRLLELLEAHEVNPGSVELEITESTIMSNPLVIRQVATDLEEVGVALSIGNFGTGYSSLSYLSHLPISKLKIDRSFVRGMVESKRQRIIVGATIELAHGLGIEVVAEGVEDAQTLDLLRELGSDFVQGFHIGLPVEPGSFAEAGSDSVAA
jgi:diguanylate cyclase (GGDEF)-like protein